MHRRRKTILLASGLFAAGLAGLLASPARGAIRPATARAAPACSSPSHPELAAQMTAQIAAALRSRESAVGLAVGDPATGLTCELDASQPFDSASVVKATILAALLHRDGVAPDQDERREATRMITESDNGAASDLWADLGPTAMRDFLALASMTQTVPGPGGLWGLTQVTARDQMRLLHLLTTPNGVLGSAARAYELGLMSQVEPAQRWGVSAGAPAGTTVELKNGWLPRATLGWRINSIGCVAGTRPEYCLVVLTDSNPTMAYGVQTVSDVAEVVNRDLNSPLALAAPPATAAPGTPATASAPPATAGKGGTAGPARLAGTAQVSSLPTALPGKGGSAAASPVQASPATGPLTSAPGSLLPLRDWLGIALIAAALALFIATARLARSRRP